MIPFSYLSGLDTQQQKDNDGNMRQKAGISLGFQLSMVCVLHLYVCVCGEAIHRLYDLIQVQLTGDKPL